MRNFHGRFLKLDMTNGRYCDIGDKQAINKTSQALREGQSKIRQLLFFKNEDEAAYTPEGYFAYSVKVLSQLYSEDKNPDVLLNQSTHLQLHPLPPPKKPPLKQNPTPFFSLPVTHHTGLKTISPEAAVRMALDQFPMANNSLSMSKKGKHSNAHFNNEHKFTRHQSNYTTDFISDNKSHISDMDVSMASLSTISAIHTISSGMSSEASHPRGCRGSFDTMITSNSHKKLFEAEKRFHDLDFIDEVTTLEEVSGRNVSESIIESHISSKSICDLSMDPDTEEMVKHLLGLSEDEDGFGTSFEI